jgi:hypothetical protein
VNFHIKNIVGRLQANDCTHAVTIAIGAGFSRFECHHYRKL